jgi:hypothetical protein
MKIMKITQTLCFLLQLFKFAVKKTATMIKTSCVHTTCHADFGLWNVDFGMRLWIVDCGLWIVDCGFRNEIVDCGMWNVECGMWNVECGMWNVECGMWISE